MDSLGIIRPSWNILQKLKYGDKSTITLLQLNESNCISNLQEENLNILNLFLLILIPLFTLFIDNFCLN